MRGDMTAKLFKYIRENPHASNKDIAFNIGTTEGAVKAFIYRYRERGELNVNGYGEDRTVTIIENNDTSFDIKRDTYLMMLGKYSEFFENTENLAECVDIGKVILKVLEKL